MTDHARTVFLFMRRPLRGAKRFLIWFLSVSLERAIVCSFSCNARVFDNILQIAGHGNFSGGRANYVNKQAITCDRRTGNLLVANAQLRIALSRPIAFGLCAPAGLDVDVDEPPSRTFGIERQHFDIPGEDVVTLGQ